MSERSIEAKAAFVDQVLGFYLESPLLGTALLMPSPQGEVDNWYLLAQVFQAVLQRSGVGDADRHNIFLLVEDANAELTAARFLGIEPDTETELGSGYDLPAGFAQRMHAMIWQELLRQKTSAP